MSSRSASEARQAPQARLLSRRARARGDAAPLTSAPGLAAALHTAPSGDDHLLPTGYLRTSRTATLARRDLHGAATDLFRWRPQLASGLRVRSSDLPLRVGTVVVLRLGVGPLALRIPCRVTEVVDEPDRAGFTYATLPGHPVSGVERFSLDRGDDGAVRFTVAAVSALASVPARCLPGLARRVQAWMVGRYLAGLDR
ncbi:uncharacterized conserved protein [Sanguibacter keddieii DSM 10542]|uniref:Uncharacterized conserved protein n=1 Tax=Sanguibacter keddieii (strain ATCC 51767 / DSM 10542 / NCFB 3025 / ST-74) TaxID=446469 RepID=D1BBS3_SANKS|nr:DUF1990 domain-containing protein [Sanguibacter keddieii]ACZ22844.1 uncharacterized conserved protein [Sanguibacter keddieii DSM 10542]